MKVSAIANSPQSLQTILGDIRQAFEVSKYLKITFTSGKTRSLPQNAISHEWYEQIHRELREGSVLQIKAECKLHFGVPILRAESDEFRTAYDSRIKDGFTYEQKLVLMESFPVTSLMNKAQLSEYLEAMQKHYLSRGVILEFTQ